MASVSSSSPPIFSYDDDKLDLESVRRVIAVINQHITALLADTESWKSLKLKCSSKLDVCCNRGYLEFSEQSILSNLYWGIESIEAALQEKWSQARTSRLQNSENMLQVPASLEEQGETAGIPNSYLTGYSYFFLSIVRRLQGDEWQVAMHFLQALVVSPRLLHTEIATELCRQLSVLCFEQETQLKDENEVYDMMVKMARRYKAWLMYYQIMSSGDAGSLRNGEVSSIPSTPRTQPPNASRIYCLTPSQRHQSTWISVTAVLFIDTTTDAGLEKKQETPNINVARKGSECVGNGSSGGLYIFNLQYVNEQHPGTGIPHIEIET